MAAPGASSDLGLVQSTAAEDAITATVDARKSVLLPIMAPVPGYSCGRAGKG